jgi:hypothetical protein
MSVAILALKLTLAPSLVALATTAGPKAQSSM